MEVADTERRGEHDKIYLGVECYEKGVVQYKKVVGAGIPVTRVSMEVEGG